MPEATTVRIRRADKEALDALQARYRLETGGRISLEDLLGRILELAEGHEDELWLKDEAPKLTPAEIKRFLSGTSDWGVVTREEDIDGILYGGSEEDTA